jgi:hypothetical protein
MGNTWDIDKDVRTHTVLTQRTFAFQIVIITPGLAFRL